MPDSNNQIPKLQKNVVRKTTFFLFIALLIAGLFPGAPAFFSRAAIAQTSTSTANFADLSLEELMNIQVTSVSRRAENLSDAPASIFVITAEDIRRSGATTLPEILRLAPNLQVARVDTVQYAITARGFNNTIGNKLLVLLDGRTIYTPMFSGVFWEMQDTILEDIDRVEVISGPGATLWGANAVNGVINIISGSASETQGVLAAVDAGDNERGVTFRKGGIAGNDVAYRVYGKFREFDNTILTDGSDVLNSWNRGQVGFRVDWSQGRQDFTVQGDISKGESEHRGFAGTIEIPAVENRSMNLLGRWNRALADGSTIRAQAYWSHNEREEFILFSPETDLFDLEFQHTTAVANHNLVWGGGLRHARDTVGPGAFTIYIPSERTMNWENVFIQDEFRLSPRLSATLGVKLEWNDYTGMEYLPNARLAWEVSPEHLIWTAVSRAVRAPSRFDRDVYFPEAPPFIIAGGPDFEAEVATVGEIGYRAQFTDRLNYSITAYYHDWDKLRSGTSLPLPAFLVNNIEGKATGLEAWASWRLLDFWVVSGGVTLLDKELNFKAGTSDTVGVNNSTLHNDPDYQWMIRSSMNFGRDFEFDLFLRGVDELSVTPVPAYNELNMRLAWKPLDTLEISLTGRNLLHEDHAEFGALPGRNMIRQGILLGVKWTPR